MSSGDPLRILVVAHGDYARALVDTAEALVGELGVTIFALDESAKKAAMRRALDLAAGEGPALLLTDLCGATPANVCLEVAAARADREVVTGLSLPMLVRLSTATREGGLAPLGRQLQATTRRTICLRQEMVARAGEAQEAERGGSDGD